MLHKSYCLSILILLYLFFSSLLRSGLLEILNLDSFFANFFLLYRRHQWESPSLISVPLVWTGTVCFTLLTDTVLALAVFLKLGALSMLIFCFFIPWLQQSTTSVAQSIIWSHWTNELYSFLKLFKALVKHYLNFPYQTKMY